MSAALQRAMTPAEFLAWDEAQEGLWEFDGFAPVAMNGGTIAHAVITRTLTGLLWQALRGRRCQVFAGNLRLATGRTYRYPDAVVSCTPAGRGSTFVRDPLTVFEVLSSITAMTDATSKNSEYRGVASIQRYVMLDQDRIAATVFVRVGDEWVGRRIEGAEAMLDMPEIEVRLRLGDIYEDAGLDEASA